MHLRASPASRRFRAVAEVVPGGKHWDTSIVRIFDGETEVGNYARNYGTFGVETFEPFEQNGKWYALYSRDYTSTRVMTLPDCQDIGGEEEKSNGFCPVELWVPRYKSLTASNRVTGDVRENWRFESYAEQQEFDSLARPGEDISLGPWKSLETGFVAGCHWGDDNSWKLQAFDLSRAFEGIITLSERFGYLRLGKMPLAEAVRLERHSPYIELRATVFSQDYRDVATGQVIDPFE
jgi:hypothetical protein